MSNFGGWAKVLIITGGALTVTACASYPTEPRYSIRADQPSRPAPGAYPNQTQPYQNPPGQPYPGSVNEAPPPLTAPIESIEGGALGSQSTTSSLNGGPARPSQSNNYPAPAYTPPAYNPPAYNPPASGGSTYDAPNYSPPTGSPVSSGVPSSAAGLAYVIQPGDTISGVGRRFQTPVQTLIDLNNLGPRGTITAGQRIILPDAAVDTGSDPYATGPAPVGVTAPRADRVPPPPAPPSGNAALPAASRASAPTLAPAPVQPRASAPQSQAQAVQTGGAIPLQWPVRGDILKPFGPVAMGERNNGVNIGASAGAVVSASAAGRVAYVGNDVAGQGLMVVIVHREGWRTVYAQLGSATVENNADVRAGQQIGTVGLTAGDGRPSIHFETRRMQGDNPVAVDPLSVLPR